MKLSLAWVFDHLASDLQRYDATDIVKKLGQTTAEIDGYTEVSFAWEDFFIGEIATITSHEIKVYIPEEKRNYDLPTRPDVPAALVEDGYAVLLKKEKNSVRWATLRDLGAEREGLVPLLAVEKTERAGNWRSALETRDVIIDIDNKSLTNRPDLWGHRGMAREIAALYGIELLPEERFCTQLPVRHYELTSPEIILESPASCSRFAGMRFSFKEYTPSVLAMVHRLARVDAKSLHALVDCTNYVLYDLGHPMHAYDAEMLSGPIVVRQARCGEKIQLLDGELVTLEERDCVVCDQNGPVALAGIMGGAPTSITPKTRQVFLEAAHFSPSVVRQTSSRLKRRTESSIRFEKGLDPNYNTVALQRFYSLLDTHSIPYSSEGIITSVGRLVPGKQITVLHRFIVERLGTALPESRVTAILTHLGFGVQTVGNGEALAYQLTVPAWRSYRDVRIPEDVVEEVGRFYGYDHIVPVLPMRPMRPFATDRLQKRRTVKKNLAFAGGMHEVATYPLFDEAWIRETRLSFPETLKICNPLSENSFKLVTTLVPNLVRCVQTNSVHADALRFFECGRIWQVVSEIEHCEHHVCAGVCSQREGKLDFYEVKELLQKLFRALDLFVTWQKTDAARPCWIDPYESALLFVDDTPLGWCGRVNEQLAAETGHAVLYAWEFFEAVLFAQKCQERRFEPLSKYQEVVLDISMLVPRNVTVAELEEIIALADARVRNVELIDLFEKAEWGNKRSVALRYTLQDDEKTFTKVEIDQIQQAVSAAVVARGVEVR